MRVALLALGMAAAFLLSLSAGKLWIAPTALLDGGTIGWIMLELRLPRALLGLLVGAALGLSGAVLQGYLRNPLADPGVVGVSSGAALGAVAAIFLGLSASPVAVFASAMAGAAGTVALLVLLVRGGEGGVVFVLAGTVIASLAGALTAFLLSVAPDPYAAGEITGWLMGALTDRQPADVLRAAPFIVVGMGLLALTGRALDALTLGERAAASLGVRAGRLRMLVVIGTGLSVGAAVAATGVVGFVGLVVPHLLRPLVGERPSALLLPSALGGAALLLVADSLVRLVPGAAELRLGVAMALIGAPFFLVLLLRLSRSGGWS